MKLTIDRQKYRKTILIFGINAMLFFIAAILVVVMHLIFLNKEWYKTILLSSAFLLFAIIMIWPLYHLYQNRAYFSEIIKIEDGKLICRTSVLRKKQEILIDNISSIICFQKSRKLNEIIIKTKAEVVKSSSLIAQLNGSQIHITDSFVKSKEFKKMAIYIESLIVK